MTIKITNLSYKYGKDLVLDDISFTIKDKDFVALIGPNGSGKTTLVKLLLGLLKPQKGSITIYGKAPMNYTHWDKVGYVPQSATTDPNFPGTVREIISLRTPDPSKICDELGMMDFFDQKFTELSGGQQQRVLIALAMCKDPKLLILDEPTVGVDLESEKKFYSLLKHINEDHGVTVVLVTHEIGVIPNVAKHVICINRQLACYGPAHKTHTLVKKMYSDQTKVHAHGP